MRDLLCAFASLCALLAPAASYAQVAPPSAPHTQSARRITRVSRADRNELRRSLAMLSQGPSAPSMPAMRAAVLPPPAGAATQPSTAPTSQARIESALRTVERSGLIRRCWQHHLMRNPNELGRSAVLNVRVGPDGRWSALTLDVTDADALASCVSLGMHTLAPLAPGDPIESRAPITLDRGAP